MQLYKSWRNRQSSGPKPVKDQQDSEGEKLKRRVKIEKCEYCDAYIYDFQVLRRRCAKPAGEEEGKRALRQISKLTNFIMTEVKDEPTRRESAIDYAIRIICESSGVMQQPVMQSYEEGQQKGRKNETLL